MISENAYNVLKPKFHPFCIGHPACQNPKAVRALQVWQNALTHGLGQPIKGYIKDLGEFIIKSPRKYAVTTFDTHLYRVRKAEKIRRFIHDNELDDHFAVPEKFILPDPSNYSGFVVIAEKLALSNEVGRIFSEDFAHIVALQREGQFHAYATGAPQRRLNAQQVNALARLAFLGYNDQNYNNLFFTIDGKIAILDTEPLNRFMKKALQRNVIRKCLGLYNHSIANLRAFHATSDLKFVCSPVQQTVVERIEYLKSISKMITRLAVCTLGIYALMLLSLSAIFLVPIVTLLCAKILIHIKQTLTIYSTYMMSLKGYAGYRQIGDMIDDGQIA